jgi:hypothetical protein
MSLTYGLRSSRDLFEKLKRDANLLDEEVTSDRFFNFVVTGYSIVDWVKNDPTVPFPAKSAIETMYSDRWIKVCGDLATASKHFVLTKRTPITSKADSQQGFGSGRFGSGGFGVGEEDIQIELNDGTFIYCLDFVSEVVHTWEQFFQTHGM